MAMALQVIGAGFGRTGTMSLKGALERLGFSPCHHMLEVAQNPAQLPYWQAAARGELPDWDEVFADYAAQVDWPGARFWRELATHYPAAKVILSTRPADAWFDSFEVTIGPILTAPAHQDEPDRRAHHEMVREIILQQEFGGRIDREHATAVFRKREAEVKATIAPERLLVWSARDGWEPLCHFLEVPVPDEAFPRTNSTEEFRSRLTPQNRPSVDAG